MNSFLGRPYSPPVTWLVTFTGAAGESHAIWVPRNSFFEVAGVLAFGTAAVELQIADTVPSALLGFIGLDGLGFSMWTPGALAGVRSNGFVNTALLLVDPVGVAGTVHGTCYGWEVTPDGGYR